MENDLLECQIIADTIPMTDYVYELSINRDINVLAMPNTQYLLLLRYIDDEQNFWLTLISDVCVTNRLKRFGLVFNVDL